MMRSTIAWFTWLIAAAVSVTDQAMASGFAIYDHGAKEQAQGNAIVATVDTPAALFYNPSRLGVLKGPLLRSEVRSDDRFSASTAT